ncbi:MAG: M28 family peptidase [Solirubrobacteraceae bacterium]
MRAPFRLSLALLLLGFATVGNPSAARADHPQPARDISKLDYSPQGFFKAGDPVPLGNACKTTDLFSSRRNGLRFNPSGKYNAFDSNVYEVFCLPFREADDMSAADEFGGGDGSDPGRGFCAGAGTSEPQPGPDAPLSVLAGQCPNHQLEYIEYYEQTMRDILGDFGVETKRFEFQNPGSGNTFGGRAINPAAVVPGADHPEDTVIIGAHYDQTTEGPASAWDSAEGHAQVIRVAKLMADYWRSTGTRPSATVKFIPWDGEESGTLGSLDYVENNIVPGEENQVRGYWNTDPCAGGYPAFRNGNPSARIALGIQIARPEEIPGDFDVARVQAFNDQADDVVEQVFERLDDTVPVTGGQREVFISMAEALAAGTQADAGPGGPVVIGDERPVLFSSDWANFLAKGVPFFNPGPEVTGPGDDGGVGNPDGLAILHTPNDNIVTLNRMTAPGTGETFSAGWMKGMEMCADLLAWGMLRDDQGGSQTANGDVVAYYEALPNEAQVSAPVTFDAGGSYEYESAATRTRVPASRLEYSWDFGDGTTGTGAKVDHAYATAGVYESRLTVRDNVSGETDVASIPITVIGAALAGPVLAVPPADDADDAYELSWTFDETTRPGFSNYRVQEAPDASTPLNDPAEDLTRWTPSAPTEPVIQPWQLSDQAGDSVRGNVHSSGARGFYTGIDRADQMPGVGPSSGVSILELKDPVALTGSAELSYRSSYANDRNDVSRVEAAVVDGGALDWQEVDSVRTTNFFNVPIDEVTYPDDMELRRVDLSAFAGKQVKLRFVYALGAAQFVNVFRTGWYVDDIRIDTGTFTTIAEPAAKTQAITGRAPGAYAYRVLAVYNDGVSTRASNVERVNVAPGAATPTPSATPTAAGTPTTGTGPGSGPGTGPGGSGPSMPSCAKSTLRASVKPLSDGRLKLSFDSARPVTIDVLRQSRGSRVIPPERVARFSRTRSFVWDGEATERGATVERGVYVARFRSASGVRRFGLRRTGERFVRMRAFDRNFGCAAIRFLRLSRPVFGGVRNVPLRAGFELARAGEARIELLRGGRVVRRFVIAGDARRRVRIVARGLRRGQYGIRLTVAGSPPRTVFVTRL